MGWVSSQCPVVAWRQTSNESNVKKPGRLPRNHTNIGVQIANVPPTPSARPRPARPTTGATLPPGLRRLDRVGQRRDHAAHRAQSSEVHDSIPGRFSWLNPLPICRGGTLSSATRRAVAEGQWGESNNRRRVRTVTGGTSEQHCGLRSSVRAGDGVAPRPRGQPAHAGAPGRDRRHRRGRRSQLAERFGCPYRGDLETGLFDAVIVASPTETHFEWVSRALELGLPVLVGNALAFDLCETRTMIDRAAALDVPLMCGFIERFNPAVMLATEIVKAPLYVQSFRHSPYVPRIRGGVAGDLLIHDVDLALRLFGGAPVDVTGPTRLLSSAVRHHRAEDVAEAQLSFAGGGLATLSASRIAQQKIRQLRVHDLDRMLEVDLVRQDITVLRHVDNEFDESGAYRQQTVIDVPAIANRREPLVTQLEHFIALIDGQFDHAAERATLLAPHEVIARVLHAQSGDRARHAHRLPQQLLSAPPERKLTSDRRAGRAFRRSRRRGTGHHQRLRRRTYGRTPRRIPRAAPAVLDAAQTRHRLQLRRHADRVAGEPAACLSRPRPTAARRRPRARAVLRSDLRRIAVGPPSPSAPGHQRPYPTRTPVARTQCRARRPPTAPMIRMLTRWADPYVVVMDQQMHDYIRTRYHVRDARMVPIPVGVDIDRFANADVDSVRARLGIGNAPLILSVGHVIPIRNRLTLVEAMPAVLAVHPERASSS